MAEVKESRGTSPSKSVDNASQTSWKGGVDHGVTDPKTAISQSPNKHTYPVPIPEAPKK